MDITAWRLVTMAMALLRLHAAIIQEISSPFSNSSFDSMQCLTVVDRITGAHTTGLLALMSCPLLTCSGAALHRPELHPALFVADAKMAPGSSPFLAPECCGAAAQIARPALQVCQISGTSCQRCQISAGGLSSWPGCKEQLPMLPDLS
jgi:hypothetical protein